MHYFETTLAYAFLKDFEENYHALQSFYFDSLKKCNRIIIILLLLLLCDVISNNIMTYLQGVLEQHVPRLGIQRKL